MDIEAGDAHSARLLVVSGGPSDAWVVDVDGEAAEREAADNGPELGDWGIEYPDGVGLWVWDGTILYPLLDDSDGYELEYDGEWRRATPDEALKFAAGDTPWT